jgi:hypothetical protein
LYLARQEARSAVAKAQEAERRKMAEMLEREDGKRNVFRVTKQLVRNNKDVVGQVCVKDKEGKVVAENEKILEVWRDYFDKLLNEEFEWDRNSLSETKATSGSAQRITETEVMEAIAKSKPGKAPGPSGVVTEMLKAAGA